MVTLSLLITSCDLRLRPHRGTFVQNAYSGEYSGEAYVLGRLTDCWEGYGHSLEVFLLMPWKMCPLEKSQATFVEPILDSCSVTCSVMHSSCSTTFS
jgi:hypothetical protein